MPSRLIGHQLRVRLSDDGLDVFVGPSLVTLRCGRSHPNGKYDKVVDYRHVIHSLPGKPMAQLNLVYLGRLFPRDGSCRTIDCSRERLPDRKACRIMVDLLALGHGRGCEADSQISSRTTFMPADRPASTGWIPFASVWSRDDSVWHRGLPHVWPENNCPLVSERARGARHRLYDHVVALRVETATAPAEALLYCIGWRGLFEVLAASSAATAAVIYFLVPEQDAATKSPRGIVSLKTVYTDGRFWRIAPISSTCIGSAWALQSLWAASWLSDVEGLDRTSLVTQLLIMAIALSIGHCCSVRSPIRCAGKNIVARDYSCCRR
ncbi:hypothetical protein ABIC07_008359 [Bradyrhizobium sp. RT9a]